MGNLCCRREVYAPNGTETDQSRCGVQQQHTIKSAHPASKHPAMSSAYHQTAGDDCAINELLEGRMDLDVLMPDGRKVKLTVERRTPMMDLLVQAASATKISPGGHVIHVFGEGDKGNGTLQYKPSTPIGSLDTNTICIVPKKETGDQLARRLGKTANRPFEPTFRVQVHLPRNQLTVLRVSPRIKISELKSMVCKEKGLDTGRYQLVRPSSPTQPLAGDTTLAEYGSTEITLLSNSSIESHISTSHIIPYSKRNGEQIRKNGILRLLAEDVNNKVNQISNSNPTFQMDGNQKTKPSKLKEVSVHQHRFKPKKRRPAPPPPPPEAPSHSRQSSSDSSGYHEATSSSLLHHEDHSAGEEKASSDSSGVSSMDAAKGGTVQPSPPPPIPNAKKKKAPAPPPPPPVKEKIAKKVPAPVANKIMKQKDSSSNPKNTSENRQDSSTDVKNPNAGDSTDPKKPNTEDSTELRRVVAAEVDSNSQKDNNQVHRKDVAKTEQKPRVSSQEDSKALQQVVSVSSQQSDEDAACSSREFHSKDSIPRLENTPDGEEKDRMSRSISRDPIPPKKDSVPSPDHVIPEDPVPKRDAEQKRESEGHPQLRPAPVTVAAKVPPAAKASADAVTVNGYGSDRRVTAEETKLTKSVPLVHEKKESTSKSEAASTRVALVALNARIEQDVTQQEIASSIRAAFHSLDYSQQQQQQQQPSLLAIKQRNIEDSPLENNASTCREQQNSDNAASTCRQQRLADKNAASNGRQQQQPLADDSAAAVSTVRVVPLPSSDDESPKFRAPERRGEALLIDEEPPLRPSKNLKRSSSLLNFAEVTAPSRSGGGGSSKSNSNSNNRRTSRQLQRSLSDLRSDGKDDFEAEQERLQREYIKLQRQFILWQQQLMNNHAMLREECIVPQYARTLRQSHSLPEGEDDYTNESSVPPLVSRSLSYEPTHKDRGCSTLPRSAINITSFEFGSIPALNNGTSTLRSSKTKSYFKPPQIRASTKSRQRLPPEIKKEGDVDITDDTKMLKTILPSFDSLKLITENGEEDILLSSILRDATTTTKATPVVHKSLPSTFPKINNSRPNNNNGSVVVDKDLKYVNGDSTGGQSNNKLTLDCPKVTEQSLPTTLPPPPPPLEGLSKCPAPSENCVKSSGQRNGVGKRDFTPQVDPREQLMLEIRKFGGRTALRKISLAS